MERANGNSYTPLPGKIPGAAVNLGGREFILAPLNLDGVQAAAPLWKSYAELTDIKGTLEVAAKVLLLSLRRNYPDITERDVLGLLDTGNVLPAMLALAKLSGYQQAAPGEITPAPH